MQGRRLPDGFHYQDAEPGDYWKQCMGLLEDENPCENFYWTVCDPKGRQGTIPITGDEVFEVTEHEDGTITVSPSIWDKDNPDGYHGHLVKGVWSP